MIQRYLDQIKTIIQKHLLDKNYEIYLFGSRIKHADNPSADIDIGIEGPNRIDTHVLYRILHDIKEPTIPYLVDVVDFKRSNERFTIITKKRSKKATTTPTQEMLTTLISATARLQEALCMPETPLQKDATIQRFEFTFELSWKLMQRIIREEGIQVFGPKDAIRQAARIDLINNPERWFYFLQVRNHTTHLYNESKSLKIYMESKHFPILHQISLRLPKNESRIYD